MKKIYLLIILIISFVGVASAQTTHDKISYQSVVRTGDNHLVYDTWVTVAVSIANDDAPSVVKYSEKHTVLSNANGLISFLIGDGVDQHGNWNAVKWNRAEITLVTSVNGNVLSTHTYPLSAVPYALYAKIADTASYADSVDLDVVQNFLNEHGYLPEEPQVLSISNDTIYLTRGGWVKLPEGFSGDYNDLTNKPDLKPVATSGDYNDLVNKPTKSDLCDSVKDCVTGWISDSTRMVFDTLHDHYATKNALRDTAEAIRGALVDTAGNIRGALVDTAFDIRGALVDTAAAIRADMGDAAHDAKITIQKNGVTVGDFTLNQATPDTIDITVPTTVAELTDAGNYVTNAKLSDTLKAYTTTSQIDTLLGDYATITYVKDTLKAYYDTTLTKKAIHDTANALRGEFPTVNDGQITIAVNRGTVTNPSFTVNQEAGQVVTINIPEEVINNGQLTIITEDDTTRFTANQSGNDTVNLSDFVTTARLNDTLKAYTTTDKIDTIVNKHHFLTSDSMLIVRMRDSIQKVNAHVSADSLVLANRIHADSLKLATRMDTLLKHVCDSVKPCVTGWINDTLNAYTTTNEIDSIVNKHHFLTSDSTLIVRMRDSIQKVNAHVSADSLVLATRMDTLLKHVCDSVKPCVTDWMNDTLKAYTTTDEIDSIVNKHHFLTSDSMLIVRMRDSIQKVNAHVSADSLVLANRIHADSLKLSTRMDTLLKHVCDSVKPCVTDWMNDTLKAYTTTNKIDTIVDKHHFLTSDSALIIRMRDSIQKVNAHVSADSLVLATRMDTLLKHVCDSVKPCVTGWMNDTLNAYTTTDEIDSIVNKHHFLTSDSTLIVRMRDSIQKVNAHVSADSLVLATRMDTLLKHVCDSVKPCVTDWMNDTLKAYTTTNAIDSIVNKHHFLTSDSALIVRMRDSIQKVNTHVSADSLVLATRMDTLLKHVCDTVKPCVTGWMNDTLSAYYTKTQVDSADSEVRSEIGKGTLTITYGTNPTTTVQFGANQDTNTTVTIPTPPTPTYGTLTITKNNDETVGTFIANVDNTININVPTCDSLANCAFIKDILDRLVKLERQNDSLARELDKMKPSLTLKASQDTVTVCAGSTKPVTYTTIFHNCSSSDYTFAWKVDGVDSSNVTGPTLTFNAPDIEGNYVVICVATRAGNPTVTDTVTTRVEVDNVIPTFDTTVRNLTVELSNITNTATIQWDTDSLPVTLTGSSAAKTYSVADTVTITATSERGCTLSKQAILQPVKPAVATVSIPTETIKATTAIVNGTVTSDGGIPSTRRGMVYSTTVAVPRLGLDGVDSVMNDGTGKGNYACKLKPLIPCTEYRVCAFAINEVDTVYGDSVIVFTTPSFNCGDSLVDIDDNKYATLLLGSQCWMKQNLRVSRFADGTEIPLNHSVYPSSSPCRYLPGSVNNINAYGYLYNWAAAMGDKESSADNPSGVQGACPDGWHLPSDAEWTQLFDFVASDAANVCDDNPSYIAKALASQERWLSCSGSGACEVCDNLSTNNKTGFSALPSGVMNAGGGIEAPLRYDPGYTIFISATEYYDDVNDNYNNVWTREIYDNYVSVDRTATEKMDGLSVRCVLNCTTGHTYMPTVSAVKITNTGGTISLAASVDSDGGATVTERGVCWSKTQQPTADSTHTSSGSGIGAFSVPSTLTPGTPYYVRAYAINSVDTAYGAEVQLVIPIAPTVTTAAVTDITTFTAISGGEVTVGGSATVTARGVCWSTSENPTISDSLTTDGGGTGSFTSHIAGLKAATTYYLRAYATNSGGTSYGSQVSFTTPDTLPEVTTSAVSNITVTTGETPVVTVVCGGEVTSIGVDAVTARGVCWSTSQNPTISGSCTTDGNGLGSFTSNITGLSSGPTYYVRAYATNSEGTAYGDQVSFTIPVVDDKSCPDAPTVIDHEGNVYATVQITWEKNEQVFTQCWMRENLRTTTSPKTGTYLVNESGYCSLDAGIFTYTFMGSKVAHYPNNNSTDVAKYGMLYNWCAVMDTANPTNYVEVYSESTGGNKNHFEFTHSEPHRGICPVGWHVPNNQDWNNLTSAFGQAGKLAGGNDWSSSTTSTAPGNYNYYPDRNISGFTALPAGKFNDCSTDYVSRRAYFWGSVQMHHSDPPYAPTVASCTYLDYNNNAPYVNRSEDISQGLSVRCIRNSGHAAEVFVTTDAASDIAQTSATLNGSISGSSNFVDKMGFEWKLTSSDSYNPKVYVTGTTLSHNLTGLTHNTSYTFRAFIETDDETTIYGYEKRFITRADHFIVETEPATNISQTGATLHGSIANPDPATTPVLVRGFEWKETDSVSYYQAIVDDDTQDYNLTLSYDLTVLKPNRSYTVRAFATVDTGTVYGSNVSFTTPSLSLSASPSDDTLFICAGSQTSITYTAAFANVNSSDYTISWKVNGTDSSAATNHQQLTINVGAKGAYKVVCVATREGYSTLTDTITTYLNTKAPAFTVTTDLLIVNLSNIENTDSIQWDMDSDPVSVGGTSATHDYTSKGAGTYTITATGPAPDRCTATQCVTVSGKRYCNVAAHENEHEYLTNTIDSLYDVQGHSYAVVQIGSQCWMAQNLRVTKYYNEVTNSYDTILGGLDQAPSYSYSNPYFYNPVNGDISACGYLYNWAAATGKATITPGDENAKTRGVCPEGWHLPSSKEFEDMLEVTDAVWSPGKLAGPTPKTWVATSNQGAPGDLCYEERNSSGFSALRAGYYDGYDGYYEWGAFYWTCYYEDYGYNIFSKMLYMYNNSYYCAVDLTYSDQGLSVRCIRN